MTTHSGDEAEILELRNEIEAYRLRELEDLRGQLVEARAQAAHYRAEAERNAQIGHQIASEAESERGRLRERINVLEQAFSGRPPRSGGDIRSGQ